MSTLYNDVQIIFLQKEAEKYLSEYRLKHTLGVARMAIRLAELYCPEKTKLLQAAALLHDITKEFSKEEQLQVFYDHGILLTYEELASPSTWHAMTAALIIPERYSELADEELISAVRYHTTGRENMSLSEKLIYLADYIEDGRTHESCVLLNREFFDAHPENMTNEERMVHLDSVLLHSFDLTLTDLCHRGKYISLDTIRAYNGLIYEIENKKGKNDYGK